MIRLLGVIVGLAYTMIAIFLFGNLLDTLTR